LEFRGTTLAVHKPFGEYFQGYLESGNMVIFIEPEDRLVIQADYNSYPNYGAFGQYQKIAGCSISAILATIFDKIQ
jgi:hypothetical protein